MQYSILLNLFNACLDSMKVGNELKDVYVTAKSFLAEKDASLLTYLPKSLGFATGLEFRDSLYVLNDKNSNKFSDGMVFNLAVGFHNVPLSPEDKEGSTMKLSVFSFLVADTVRIQATGAPDVLTKMSKDFGDVSYTISNDEVDTDF